MMKDQVPSRAFNQLWFIERSIFSRGWGSSKTSGKWMMFRSMHTIDELWRFISKACRDGRLGPAAKCSTRAASVVHEDTHVICVYTKDWQDRSDVDRVRDELRSLGVTEEISYKRDADTRAGSNVITYRA